MSNVYSVYDSCSGIFGDPFIAPNDAYAQRVFNYSLSDPDLPKYIREDAVLYALGYFDSKTGYFTSDVPPYVVCRASSVVLPDVSRNTSASPEVDQIEE